MKPVAKIIEDSISPHGIRATTILVRYPRMIHPEMMTHKTPARNGRSSRAVPVKVLLQEPIVEPLFYGGNRPGMSAGDELTGWRYLLARGAWLGLAMTTKLAVRVMHFAGLHKQWANRPLEWFGSIDMLYTAVAWKNFDVLRIHDAAQPEARATAIAMRDARDASTPKLLQPGEWHLPFVTEDERTCGWFSLDDLKVMSVARCARLTYEAPKVTYDPKEPLQTVNQAERARYERLVLSKPVHASPAEHVLTPDHQVGRGGSKKWARGHMHGCTPGWVQHRHEIEGHFIPG